MKYKCISCGAEWSDSKIDGVSDGEFSHGFCKECVREKLAPYVRRRQLSEGFFDCFGRAEKYCDQLNCKYRDICLKE